MLLTKALAICYLRFAIQPHFEREKGIFLPSQWPFFLRGKFYFPSKENGISSEGNSFFLRRKSGARTTAFLPHFPGKGTLDSCPVYTRPNNRRAT